MNCAAIPPELIESELFGHVKGSFTGAVADRAGKFEQADGGTLFLDEIGDMSLVGAGQAAARAAGRRGRRASAAPSRSQVDVRVIAATNKDLEEEIAEGRFREDLLYRLNVVPIDGAAAARAARGHPGAGRALRRAARSAARACPARRSPRTRSRRLQQRRWPGNVRELRNAVERLLILAPGKVVTAADVDRLLPAADGAAERRRRSSLDAQDVRGVQERGGEGVPAAEAPRARLERVGDRAGARDAALEPVQEDRALRPEPGAG